jgi:hypothetical protein
MVLCTAQVAPSSIKDDNVNDVCQNGLLSKISSGSTERQSNGMLKESEVNRIVTLLVNQKMIPSAPVDVSQTDEYVAKLDEFINTVKMEYMFYDARYRYSLGKLLAAIRQAYMTPTEDTTRIINVYLVYTQTLNRKVNDLTQLMNAITDTLLQTSDAMQASLTEFKEKLAKQREKLDKQNKIITSSEAVTKLQKEMVKYSEEKSRYTDNLLKMYSFLNIVVLGLLFYIYRASSESE